MRGTWHGTMERMGRAHMKGLERKRVLTRSLDHEET